MNEIKEIPIAHLLSRDVHPLAATYPMLGDVALAKLAADLKVHGQRSPIDVANDGVILDGRNRLQACRQAGLGTVLVRRQAFDSNTPEAAAFVESANLRRSMLASQEVMRCVLYGIPEVHDRGRTQADYDLARRIAKANPDRARLVFETGCSLRIVAKDLGLLPAPVRRPKTPAAPPRPPITADDMLGATKAKAARSEAEAKVKVLATELQAERDRSALFAHLTGAPLPDVRRYELTSGRREATAWALISDLHVETLVRPEDTPTGNRFCMSIAELRLGRTFESVAWALRTHADSFLIRQLVLWFGGDWITNHLHPDNVETAQLGPGPAALWVQARAIRGVQSLLDTFPDLEILIPCNVGNHGRTTEKMRTSTVTEHSWEWLIYNAIAAHFANETRVKVHAPAADHTYLTVYDFDLHFHHGHAVSYHGGSGGITIPLNKACDGWDKSRRSDYHFFGHFHQYIDLGRFTVNGSLIGYDAYAMRIKASPEEPKQAFGLIDSRRGKCWTTPLWSGHRAQEQVLWNERQAA